MRAGRRDDSAARLLGMLCTPLARRGTELFPSVDAGRVQLRIRAPAGTRLERTVDIVRGVDRTLRDVVGDAHVHMTLANIGALAPGAPATFSVQAFPDTKFNGIVRHVAESLDVKTRSMPVELDVANDDGRLARGTFADVHWPVKRQAPTLFVPATAVVQSTESTFVVRNASGVAEQVPVKRGVTDRDLVEVFGGLAAGDTLAKHGSEELRTIRSDRGCAPSPGSSSPSRDLRSSPSESICSILYGPDSPPPSGAPPRRSTGSTKFARVIHAEREKSRGERI